MRYFILISLILLSSCITIPEKPSSPIEDPAIAQIPIVATKISFAPSLGATSYKLYYTKYPNKINQSCDFLNLGNVTSVKLSELELLPGTYNFGVSALDDRGSESSIRLSGKAIVVIAAKRNLKFLRR